MLYAAGLYGGSTFRRIPRHDDQHAHLSHVEGERLPATAAAAATEAPHAHAADVHANAPAAVSSHSHAPLAVHTTPAHAHAPAAAHAHHHAQPMLADPLLDPVTYWHQMLKHDPPLAFGEDMIAGTVKAFGKVCIIILKYKSKATLQLIS